MNHRPTLHAHRICRGITLVESAVATTVAAVIAGIAVPSFDQAIQRRHLEGAAAQIETDIHYARTLAVAANAPMRIGFATDAGGSCYVIHTGAANECTCTSTGAATCTGDARADRTVAFTAGGPVRVQSNSRSVLFDATRGTATPTATVQVTSRDGRTIRQVVNIMGRVRSCSPAPGLSGYPAC
jgi:type IV fimbrial biogenesis protein FimT